MIENKKTVVERIYEHLESGNLDFILQAKDTFLSLEKVDLKIEYEMGVLSQLIKEVNN